MDRLRALNEQDGFFSRADALAEGYDDRTIQRTIRSGTWRRVRTGAYSFTDLWPPTEQELHRVRGRAAARKLRDHVALSHTSAAHEHGLRTWGVDLSNVHVTRLDGGAGRTESGVVHHEGLLLPEDLVRKDGLWVTHPARAAIETASLTSTESGLVALDSALQLGLCSQEELFEAYRTLQAWPGMQRVGVAVRLADAGSQSVGESRTRYLCYAQGIPAPETQFEVRDRDGRLVAAADLAWPEHRLLGEFDGRVKYGRLLRPGEEPGDAVFREKRREDLIRELLPGWSVIRFVWSDLYAAHETAQRIRRMLNLAA